METLSRGQRDNEESAIRDWKKSRVLVTVSLKVTWKIENVPTAVVKLVKKISRKNVKCHLPSHNNV